MKKFNYSDFIKNPKKYESYKKAIMVSHVFTENGANDIKANTIVSIKYIGNVFNSLYRRNEPMYKLSNGMMVYANYLANFV